MHSIQSDQIQLDIPRRLRRNRKNAAVRALIQETHLQPSNLVAPLFVIEGEKKQQDISSMPKVKRFSIDLAIQEAQLLRQMGILAIDLFPVVPKEKKDPFGSEAINPKNLIFDAIRKIKDAIPEMCVMVDIALDPYTTHGHDGIIAPDGYVLNDKTVQILAKMSFLAAQAGADFVAPSDMMDGRIGFIRRYLDEHGFQNTGILSYAAKYASSFYGPFREGVGSSLRIGDKKNYQMDPANVREAILECSIDEREGADILMVKPALAYLDVIAKLREQTNLPIAAYQVSGEYAMIMAAAEKGWLDADAIILETLLSIKRAGADIIFTYAAKHAVNLISK